VLDGGNHAAVNHPNSAATPWEWRPEEWRDNNVNREARRRARIDAKKIPKQPKPAEYTRVSSRRVAKREAW
jgi:hypothetical protein